jgi:hypothetical protein
MSRARRDKNDQGMDNFVSRWARTILLSKRIINFSYMPFDIDSGFLRFIDFLFPI